MVTYTKLRNGQWGLRGRNLTPGATVEVTKRSGETKTEVVGKVFWTGEDGMSVASMRRSNRTSRGAWRARSDARAWNEARASGPAVEFSESGAGYRGRERWAKAYDELNGAPEGDWDR